MSSGESRYNGICAVDQLIPEGMNRISNTFILLASAKPKGEDG